MQLDHELQKEIEAIEEMELDAASNRLDDLLKKIRAKLLDEVEGLAQARTSEEYARFELRQGLSSPPDSEKIRVLPQER